MIEAKKEWYEEWFDSKYYHQLYADRDEQEAADFVQLLMETYPPGENGLVLDLACGKGRHSKEIAALGHRVHGVDLSPESIAYCKRFETEDLRFAIHDMREVYKPRTFDLVVNLFTSFGYFDDINDNIHVLEAISKDLTSKGRYIIDFLNVIPVLDDLPDTHVKRRGGIDFQIDKSMEEGRIVKHIRFDAEGVPHHYTEKVQALVLKDFQEMAAKAGLTIEEVFGDYHLQPYSPGHSPRLILTGKKSSG